MTVSDVPSSVRRRLGVAIRANDLQIAESVVIPSPVDMLELERNRTTIPSIEAARLAPALFESCRNQTLLQLVRASEPAHDQ